MAAVQGIALNQLPPLHDAQTDASSDTSSPSVASLGISPEPEAESTSPATSSRWYSHELNLANALALIGVASALVYGALQVRYMIWTAANDSLQSCLSAIVRALVSGIESPMPFLTLPSLLDHDPITVIALSPRAYRRRHSAQGQYILSDSPLSLKHRA